MSQLSRYHWIVDMLLYREDWTPLQSAKSSCLFQLCNLLFLSQRNTRTNKIKQNQRACCYCICSSLWIDRRKTKQNRTFSYGFHFHCCFFFFFYPVKGFWMLTYLMLKDSMTSLYHMLSAKQQRSGYSILQRKRVLPKQNNLRLSIFCVSFARHYLTVFSLWKQKDF